MHVIPSCVNVTSVKLILVIIVLKD